MPDCIFCKNLPKVIENELAYGIYDIKPKTKGHMLMIPKRHSTNIFEATSGEIAAMFALATQAKEFLTKEHAPDGFNVIVNCGESAGQIVMHTHVHLIPSYKGAS